MRHLTLITREDRSSGDIGLMVKQVRQIDTFMVAREGRLIAHDIIEHVNGLQSIGSVDDEIEAMGAAWYVRGQYCDLSRDGYGSLFTPEESIGRDIANLGETYHRGVRFRTPVPRTHSSDMDCAFEEIIKCGMSDLRSELRSQNEPIDYSRLTDYKTAVMHYMRQGYRKAKKRYGSSMKANSMFWNIAQAVEPYAKHAELEGQKFRLSYDRSTARCEELYEEEW